MSVTFLGGPKVKLSYSADAWELFGRFNDGSPEDAKFANRDAVAAALNAGMEKLISEAATRKDVSWGAVNELLDKYSDYGAADTEGVAMVEHILAKVYGDGGSW